MSNTELIAAAQGLTEEVTKLSQTVRAQTEAIDRLDTRSHRSNLKIRITALALCITAGVVAFNAYLVREVKVAQQDTVNTQEQVNRVLCPLYGIFLASDTPESYNELSPEQQEFRRGAFVIIREGIADLGCS